MADTKLYALKRLKRIATKDEAVGDIQDWIEQLQQFPILNGKPVKGTMRNGASQGVFNHNLGTPFSGAFLAGQSTGHAGFFIVLDANGTKAMGFDPTFQFVVLTNIGVATDIVLTYWVFA